MVGACQQLDGVFALVMLDTNAKKVFVCRDTIGVRPAYYFLSADGVLGVSSEVKGLLALQQKLEEPQTKVQFVKPGHIMEFDLQDDQTCKLNSIVSFHSIEMAPFYRCLTASNSQLDIYGNIRNLLEGAVRKRLQSNRRIGCLLSGGLDSSLIAALLCQEMRKAGMTYPLQTFAIGMSNSVDVAAAQVVANYLGTEHYVVNFTMTTALQSRMNWSMFWRTTILQ